MQLTLFENINKIKGLSIPYMGSKRKLASKIVDFILKENPNCEYFFDLFGGGGAVSFEAIQREQIKQVYYNEINTGIVELLKDIINNGVTEKYYQWVDRETYKNHINDNDWFGGFLNTCWSFGNNQEKGYLYGKEIEEIKKAAHEYMFSNGYTIGDKEKRIELLKHFKNDNNIRNRFDMQSLESLERLQSLERLESLESLQSLERLIISNLSYEKVEINTPIEKTVIYLDPPYINTAGYQNELNHTEFNEWIKNNPYKIYISSYESPFIEVASWEHRSTLSATNNAKRTKEKLFVNFT